MDRKNVSEAAAGMVPTRGASVFKLRFTESRQRIADLAAHVLGRAAIAMSDLPPAAGAGRLVADRVNTLSFTIANHLTRLHCGHQVGFGLGTVRWGRRG